MMLFRTIAVATGVLLAPACTSKAQARPTYATPIAAALHASWARTNARPPSHLALNVPPDTQVDSVLLSNDVRSWQATLQLLRDTSHYAVSMISADSLRVLGTVYDVRTVAREEWERIVTRGSARFGDTAAQVGELLAVEGVILVVAYEQCRGWPCHGAHWVEVREVSGRYVGYRVLMVAVE